MKTFIKTNLALCALALAGCGGGDPEPLVENPQTESSLITFYSAETHRPLISMTGRCQVISEAESEAEVVTVDLLCQTGQSEYSEHAFTPAGMKIYYTVEAIATTLPDDYRIFLDGSEILPDEVEAETETEAEAEGE
jgi:hypothetical protein